MQSTGAPTALGYVLLSRFEGMVEYSVFAAAIGAFCEALGYGLRGVFVDELGRSDVSSFHALLREVRLGKATVVVIPDFGHLAHLPCLMGADERTVARYVRARVVPVTGLSATESVESVQRVPVGTGNRPLALVGW